MNEELIRKAIRGDREALEMLYDRYAPALLSVCFRYCGNRDDAEDILHDSFIKIIRSIGEFRVRQDASPEAWMRRITVNTALNFIRSRTRERGLFTQEPDIDRLDSPDDPAEEGNSYPDLPKERIMEMICTLPAGYRTVFNLYVFERYSHREIANTLGCSENTSKSQLSKARALLRQWMSGQAADKKTTAYEKA